MSCYVNGVRVYTNSKTLVVGVIWTQALKQPHTSTLMNLYLLLDEFVYIVYSSFISYCKGDARTCLSYCCNNVKPRLHLVVYCLILITINLNKVQHLYIYDCMDTTAWLLSLHLLYSLTNNRKYSILAHCACILFEVHDEKSRNYDPYRCCSSKMYLK